MVWWRTHGLSVNAEDGGKGQILRKCFKRQLLIKFNQSYQQQPRSLLDQADLMVSSEIVFPKNDDQEMGPEMCI